MLGVVVAILLLKVVEAVRAVDDTKFLMAVETVGKAVDLMVVASPISGTAKCVPKTAFAFLKLCKRILSASKKKVLVLTIKSQNKATYLQKGFQLAQYY